jgi:preprotein translocase subunit SecE
MNFNIYKRGQGKNTRLISAIAAGLLAAIGCYRLYNELEATSMGASIRTTMWIATMVPVVLFVALAFLIFWIMNKPVVADFMISAEGEMKKVSWSSRQEIVASTTVVIVVVIIMAVLLGAADLGFSTFFEWFFS